MSIQELVKHNDAVLTEAQVDELVTNVLNQGLGGLQEFLRLENPARIIDPSASCSCFFHEYFSYFYSQGEFIIGTSCLEEENTEYYSSDVPIWYIVFQRRAMNRDKNRGWSGLSVRQALHIVDSMLENPPTNEYDLGEDEREV